jgi:release factor glutamine methyltransferase
MIISNPPYIASAEIDDLQPEISYEPRIALDGGRDGLDFYRRIIAESPKYLKEGGYLIMEIGFGQKDRIKNIFQKSENFEIIEVVRDYSSIERVIVAKVRRDKP